MEMIQIQLPLNLMQQVQQTLAPNQGVEQVLAEAVQLWLDNQRQAQARNEGKQALLVLRQAGLVMSDERHHAFARSLQATLEATDQPDREEVEMALAHLNPPLSQEIIALRGEG